MIAQETANTSNVLIALIREFSLLAALIATHLLSSRKQNEIVKKVDEQAVKQDEASHKQDQAAEDQAAQAEAIQEVHVLTNDRATKLDEREAVNNARIERLEVHAAADRAEIAALKAALSKEKRKPKAKVKR